MPLKEGSDPETVRQNIREMIKAGHPKEQAIAASFRSAELLKRMNRKPKK